MTQGRQRKPGRCRQISYRVQWLEERTLPAGLLGSECKWLRPQLLALNSVPTCAPKAHLRMTEWSGEIRHRLFLGGSAAPTLAGTVAQVHSKSNRYLHACVHSGLVHNSRNVEMT